MFFYGGVTRGSRLIQESARIMYVRKSQFFLNPSLSRPLSVQWHEETKYVTVFLWDDQRRFFVHQYESSSLPWLLSEALYKKNFLLCTFCFLLFAFLRCPTPHPSPIKSRTLFRNILSSKIRDASCIHPDPRSCVHYTLYSDNYHNDRWADLSGGRYQW